MYQLTSSSSIVRLSDGATIPADASNVDYQKYLAWVAAGNVAASAPVPVRNLEAEQLALLDAYTDVELRNITPAGAVRMAQMAAAGNVKAQAVSAWVDAHWAEFRQKQVALAAGGIVVVTPSSLWKPFSYSEISAS